MTLVASVSVSDAQAADWLARAERLSGLLATGSAAGIQVVPRGAWGANAPIPARMERTRGSYTRITVHHSADRTPVKLDGSLTTSAAAARQIQNAHMNGTEHMGDIGYHFLIDPSGRVFEGRALAWQGAHASGENNVQNVGVCLIGNFDEARPTAAALGALRRVLDHLRGEYKIPRNKVYNHKELKSTDCPGENLAPWVDAYRKEGVPAPAKAKPR